MEDNIIKGERILEDTHPVHFDFFYVCDGKVIRSDIHGTVLDLKRDLRKRGYKAETITNCNITERIEKNS